MATGDFVWLKTLYLATKKLFLLVVYERESGLELYFYTLLILCSLRNLVFPVTRNALNNMISNYANF